MEGVGVGRRPMGSVVAAKRPLGCGGGEAARRFVGVRGACGRSREVPRMRGIVGGNQDVRQARENGSEAPERCVGFVGRLWLVVATKKPQGDVRLLRCMGVCGGDQETPGIHGG